MDGVVDADTALAEWYKERAYRCLVFARSHTLTDWYVVMGAFDRFFERARTDAWLFEHAAHPWFRANTLRRLIVDHGGQRPIDFVRKAYYRLFGELYWHYEQAVLPVVTSASIAAVIPVPDLTAVILQYAVCGMVNQVRRQLALSVLDQKHLDSRLSSIHNLPFLRARRARTEQKYEHDEMSSVADVELDRLHAADMLLDRFAPIAHDIVEVVDGAAKATPGKKVLFMRRWLVQQAISIMNEAKNTGNTQRHFQAFSILLMSRPLFKPVASLEDDAATLNAYQHAMDSFRADPMGESCKALMNFREEFRRPVPRIPEFQSILPTWLAVKYFAGTPVCSTGADSTPTPDHLTDALIYAVYGL